MSVIGIIGGKGIGETILSLYPNPDKLPQIFCLDSDCYFYNIKFDMIIINSEFGIEKILREIVMSDENVLIINTDRKKILEHVKSSKHSLCSKIITYGFNPKACVTASSAQPETVLCCIQRSIPSFLGKQLDEQEFSVKIENSSVGNVLAAVTAALVDGLEVEQITRISQNNVNMF